MALTFNEYQIQLGKAIGLKEVNSEKDLKQITAFAKQYGIKTVDSQKDLDQLMPYTKTGSASPSPSPVVTPAGTSPIPVEAGLGTSTPSDLSGLLMQQQADLKAQNDAFVRQQQEFALQQQQQYDQIKAQIEAQARAAAAVAPGAVAGNSPAEPGWKENRGGITTLESLLLGTQAVTGAINKMVVA